MAGNPLLSGVPSIALVGVTQNSATTQNNDSIGAPVGMGRNGDIMSSELHGPYYQGVRCGASFVASAAAAGIAPLAQGGTTSGFMFYNPVGSGVNMEIIEIIVEPIAA